MMIKIDPAFSVIDGQLRNTELLRNANARFEPDFAMAAFVDERERDARNASRWNAEITATTASHGRRERLQNIARGIVGRENPAIGAFKCRIPVDEKRARIADKGIQTRPWNVLWKNSTAIDENRIGFAQFFFRGFLVVYFVDFCIIFEIFVDFCIIFEIFCRFIVDIRAFAGF